MQIARIVINIVPVIIGYPKISTLGDNTEIDIILIRSIQSHKMHIKFRRTRKFEVETYFIVIAFRHGLNGEIEHRIARNSPFAIGDGNIVGKISFQLTRKVLLIQDVFAFAASFRFCRNGTAVSRKRKAEHKTCGTHSGK